MRKLAVLIVGLLIVAGCDTVTYEGTPTHEHRNVQNNQCFTVTYENDRFWTTTELQLGTYCRVPDATGATVPK